jgi:hypothetical protein
MVDGDGDGDGMLASESCRFNQGLRNQETLFFS